MSVYRVPFQFNEYGLRSRDGLRGYWCAWRALRGVLRREPIHAAHAGRVLPEGWLAYLLKWRYGLPYLCYVHGEDVNSYSLSRELRWMARRVLRAANAVLVSSQNSRRILLDEWKLPAAKVRLLYPGADTNWFVPAERDERVRESLGWKGRTVVLTVGRLQARKGQDQMIQALRAVRRHVPDVLYSIVGDGGDRPRLEKLVAETETSAHVEFRGEPADDELLLCYQQCDLFVLPNREINKDIEGFGMVLVEAQACAKPVVAGASGGTAETMQHGRTGLIVDCSGPDLLAQTVVELLQDVPRRVAMGRAARAWAVERFDWESLARQAAEIFADALPRSERSPPASQPLNDLAATFEANAY